jgi:hypothetical protein
MKNTKATARNAKRQTAKLTQPPSSSTRAQDSLQPETQNPEPGTNPARITVEFLARELKMHKSSLTRLAVRLGFTPRLGPDRSPGGHLYTTLAVAEAHALRQHRLGLRPAKTKPFIPPEGRRSSRQQVGFFYLVLLEPQCDPTRFKLGFTVNLYDRLRAFRTSTPFADYLAYWPCLRLWEATAIAFISHLCEPLGEEVFRSSDPHQVVARAETFFASMPAVPRFGEQLPPKMPRHRPHHPIAPTPPELVPA